MAYEKEAWEKERRGLEIKHATTDSALKMHLMSKADLFLHRRRWHLEMRQGLEGDQLLDEMKSQVTENMKKRRIPPNGISEVA